MATMNPNLILAGSQGIDVLGAMDRGNALAQKQLDQQRQNALYDFMAQRGGDLMRGDENALAQYAAFDPKGAFDMSGQMQARAAAAEQTAYDRQRHAQQDARADRKDEREDHKFQLEVQKYAADLSAQERAAQAKQVEDGVKMAMTAQTPQDWDAIVTQVGAPELVGQFENREALANRFMSVAEILKAQEPAGPQSSMGKFFADQEAGLIPAGIEPPQSGVTVSIGGDGMPGLGKLSSDYGYIMDPETGQPIIDPDTGMPKAAPVPGSPAAIAAEETERKAEKADQNAANYAKTVTRDLGIASEYLDELPSSIAGDSVAAAIAREQSANVAGTTMWKMKRFVDSALSNLTLDTMNRMRESSPAGATGFGNMSERQMEVIQGVMGNWAPGLPVEDQRVIINNLFNFYQDVIYGTAEERAEAVADGRMTEEQNQEIQSQYLAEIRDSAGKRIQDGPQIGETQDGYRFKGGDPADPNSWELVQ